MVGSVGSGSSLTSGMNAAQGGIRSNVEQFAKASAEVTRQAAALSQSDGSSDASGDLGQAIVDQTTASVGVRANVKTLQAFDDMLRELTLAGARK
jgi:hypothetical protein